MTDADLQQDRASLGPLALLGLVQILFALAIWGGLLFGAAGTLAWVRAWLHLGIWVATFALNFTVLACTNRQVLAARIKRQRTTETFDKILLALLLPVTLAIPIVAGLDAVRYAWTSIPLWAVAPAVAMNAVGNTLVLWTMIVNPYLEKTVRIQAERGHRVITSGPYAIVRHPMYVGVILLMAGIPLMLGSWWTFAPVGVMVLPLVVRTVFEDRMLRRELPGYEDYAKRTRYRLLPPVW